MRPHSLEKKTILSGLSSEVRLPWEPDKLFSVENPFV